ncbi:hypothetical protein IAG25_34605 [Caballeronia sp. EK]|uniref:IS66 family insertion sequence element accessory protein TnpA n=1 Tax=Caballeronia sp. EK TaxID=2767469 RepID=UPI0016558295|nr:hypothetical protein [Caballeronia sp. EK]MBC8641962.1 hypothetical protein [Caballeronia sp. EK]
MESATGVEAATRRPRQGEAFLLEMVVAWRASGMGARHFLFEQGLVSTFGLWRKKLAEASMAPACSLAMTPDAAFVVAHSDATPLATPPSSSVDSSSARDRVIVTRAGVRIELVGVHAERIVRFVLGQLGGARC